MFAGLWKFHRASFFCIPAIVISAFVFLYNRKVEGVVGDGPFDYGPGIYAAHAYGLASYYRVFDEPNAQYGKSYFELSGIGTSIELIVAGLVVLALVAYPIEKLMAFFRILEAEPVEKLNTKEKPETLG